MDVIGIIAEYNPFHKGHKYHIDKIKEMYPNSIIVAVISSCFTQRGEISVLNKWDKAKIALENNIDLVVELPFVYSSQSADTFAKGALKILNELKVEKIVFGSESNDINMLKQIANTQINNKEFDSEVKKNLKEGNNYPTSLSLALKKLGLKKIDSPNDLLGISYIKEIIKNSYDITPVTIKRTNNYHGNNDGDLLSASEIRERLEKKENIEKYIDFDKNLLYKNTDYFLFLKYQIINNMNSLDKFQTVDEGIEGKINKVIFDVNSIDEIVTSLKTKRYTYNKINRMLVHILTNLTKEEAKLDIDYIRVLGFNNKGRNYLKKLKKETSIPIITSYKEIDSSLLDIEKRVNSIYSLIVNDSSLEKREFTKPVYFKE